MKAKIGHGVTIGLLERTCDAGKFKPRGNYVLVRAIWSEHAKASIAQFSLNADGESTLSIMNAVAFEVHAIGPDVDGIAVGEFVLNTSISGETVNGDKHAKGSPWMLVRSEDICGGVSASDLGEILAEIKVETDAAIASQAQSQEMRA